MACPPHVAPAPPVQVVALDITDTKKRLQLKATYDMAAAGHGQVRGAGGG